MRTLYFLRHANSPVTAPSIADDERPLDKRGRQDSEAMGIYCQKAKIFPQLILCSTATRTRETLTLVQPYLNQDFTVDFDAALYLASAATMHTFKRLAPQFHHSCSLVTILASKHWPACLRASMNVAMPKTCGWGSPPQHWPKLGSM